MTPTESLPLTIRLLGPSGSGKTTLGERLVRVLTERGYRVAAIKNALKHPAPPDRAGSDTQRYREAGVVAGVGRFEDGVVMSLPEADLETLRAMLAPIADVVIAEGFHEATVPTLLFDVEGKPPYDGGPDVIATIVADLERADPPRCLHRDDIDAAAELIERRLRGA